MDLLEVYNLKYQRLDILNTETTDSAKNIQVNYKLNGINELTFDIPLVSNKCKHLLNENLIKWQNEYYKIKNPNFQHDKNRIYMSIYCEHMACSLRDTFNPEFDEVGKTTEELLDLILQNTGWSKGLITEDIKTTLTYLTTQQQSPLSNLLELAKRMDAMIFFNSLSYTVDFVTVKNHDKVYIRKGLNLKNINLGYDSKEALVTRLYPFGDIDENGITIDIMSANPTGLPYIENYDYYKALGYEEDYILEHPIEFLHRKEWNATGYIDSQILYNDAIEKLKKWSKPKINCTLNAIDISYIEEYKTRTPEIGDNIMIFDEDLELEIEAKVIDVKRNFNKKTNLEITISNVIEYSSIISSMLDSTKNMQRITDDKGYVVGFYIKDATIDNAKIINLDANKITTDSLDAKIANIIQANINNLTSESIQTNLLTAEKIKTYLLNSHIITADSGIIAESSIGTAQISELNANKLTSGTINTSMINLVGSDGRMIIQDNSILIYDYVDNNLTKPYIRIQIGKLYNIINGELIATGEYGFEVRDTDGQTIMIDGQGVHNQGITDGAVDNDKVADNAGIHGSKLDIESVVREVNNGTETIDSNKIYIDNSTLDVKYTGLINTQNNHETTLNSHSSQITQNSNDITAKVSTQTFNNFQTANTNDINGVKNRLTTTENSISVLEDEIELKATRVTVNNLETTVNNNNQNFDNFVTNTYDLKINEIEAKLDKVITTYSFNYVPTLLNMPAVDWTTDEIKEAHIGDVFYDTSTAYSYRFLNEDGVYSWIQISDNAVAEAIQKANEARDLANTKNRLFYNIEPTPPYDINDFWIDVDKQLKVCINSKLSLQSYEATDWELATNYTDDSVANEAKTLAEQLRDTTIPAIDVRIQTAESHLTPEGIFNLVKDDTQYTDRQNSLDGSISDLQDASNSLKQRTLTPVYSNIEVTRSSRGINPLNAFNYINGTYENDTIIQIHDTNQQLTYDANLQIVNDKITVFKITREIVEENRSRIDQLPDEINLQVNTSKQEILTTVDDKIDANNNIYVKIESTNGLFFRSTSTKTTTLKAYLYKGNKDISNTVNADQFMWFMHSDNVDANNQFLLDNKTGKRELDVDVNTFKKANFECVVYETSIIREEIATGENQECSDDLECGAIFEV